jgi:hypothetical protein
VKRLAEDEALRGRLAAAARERAGRFDTPSIVERIEKLYLDLRKDSPP